MLAVEPIFFGAVSFTRAVDPMAFGAEYSSIALGFRHLLFVAVVRYVILIIGYSALTPDLKLRSN